MSPSPVPAGRARAFAHWYFRTADGELVLGQPPNRAIKVVGVLRAGRWVLRRGGLDHGSLLDVVLGRAGRVALIWWSLDEFLRGATPYRRTIGLACLVYALREGRRED